MNLLKDIRQLFFGQDVFISYRWNNDENRKQYAQRLAEALENRGLDCFVDTKRIMAGEDISSAIKRAIKKSKIFVLVTTNDITESKWVPRELEQATGRTIIPINVSKAIESISSDSLDKEPWNVLKNLNWIEEAEEAINDKKTPSDHVALQIDESFNGKRNKTRLTQLLFIVSAIVLLVTTIPSAGLGYWITQQIEEIEKLKEQQVIEKANLLEIQDKLGKASKDIDRIQGEKKAAEESRDAAITQKETAQAQATEADNKRKDAEAKERTAKQQQVLAEEAEELAQIREAEAIRRAEEANLIEMGSRASSWARQDGLEYPAVELALEAFNKMPSVETTTVKEIRNGLTDSVINNGYTKPIMSKALKVKISSDGTLAFGLIFNKKENKYQWNLWNKDTQVTKKIHEIENRSVKFSPESFSASFSLDNKWLVTIEGQEIRFWSIDEIRSTQTSQPINCRITDSLTNLIDMAVNKDGRTVAFRVQSGRPTLTKIKLINRNDKICTEQAIEYDYDALGIDKNLANSVRINTRGILFNASDDLLVNNNKFTVIDRSNGTRQAVSADEGYIYNVTKQKLFCNNSPFGKMSTLTEAGDLVFQSASNGIFRAIVFSPVECREIYGLNRKKNIDSIAVNYHRFDILESSDTNVLISNSFFSDKFAVIPIYNYSLTGIKFFKNNNYLLIDRDIAPLVNRNFSSSEAKKTPQKQLIHKTNVGWEEINLPPNISSILQIRENSSGIPEALSYFSNQGEMATWNPKTLKKSENCQLNNSILPIFISVPIDNNTKVAILHNSNTSLLRGFKVSIIDQSCRLVKQLLLQTNDDEEFLKVSVSDNSIAVVSSRSADGFSKVRNWDLNDIWSSQESVIQLSPKANTNLPPNQFPIAVSTQKEMILTRDDIKNNYSLFQFSNSRLIDLGLKESNSTKFGSGFFSNDSNFVGILNDGIIKIWDVKSGNNILTVDTPNINENTFYPFDFSVDGKSIAVACKDGSIRIYPTSAREYKNIAEKILSKSEQ